MAAEERNFRNQYYDKMGFRVVEEKKSLETMLSSDTIDVKKMTAFCLRFSLPIVTRPLVWKVLLTVLPPHRENHEFVYKMRCQQFDQLIGCLRLLGLAEKEEEAPQKREEADACLGATVPPRAGRRVTIAPGPPSSTPSPSIPSKKSLTFLQMYLLEEGQLGFTDGDLLSRRDDRMFLRIAHTMTEMYDDDKDAFFAAVCFFKILASKYDSVYHLMPDCLMKQLKQVEDERFIKHLNQAQFFRQIPYDNWFRGCFAGVIPAIVLDKIWDKVIAGSCMILVHVAVAILSTTRRPLMTMSSGEQMIHFLETIPSDTAEVIVNRALDSWGKTPLLLPVIAKEDSPVIIDRVPS